MWHRPAPPCGCSWCTSFSLSGLAAGCNIPMHDLAACSVMTVGQVCCCPLKLWQLHGVLPLRHVTFTSGALDMTTYFCDNLMRMCLVLYMCSDRSYVPSQLLPSGVDQKHWCQLQHKFYCLRRCNLQT